MPFIDRSNRSKLVVFLAALPFALACTSTTVTPPPEPSAPSEPAAEVSEPTASSTREASPVFEPLYFKTDESVLESDARDSLQSYAKSILDHPEWGVITIEGHCDERGTEPYNRALGSSRAAAVERHLVESGVPPERITTRSFGADRPAIPGHGEQAWRYNRRSELQVQLLATAKF
jgi:peptidoglycan-associated lipoprotein